ncbi:toll/interleukin-1 receptor domain-containing protein [Sorangium sp. So ce302]|uniref:toll/interleukin-1 receptor domain-containing protein n=1 Tax=Sorangium sp. So ce302 TaxID=3133297 RepID=UPI003F628C47
MARTKVIISYSHEDERWRKLVVAQLGVLEQAGLLDLWDDQKVPPGENRFVRLDREMLSARVALLLVSADFLKSAFIVDHEVPRLFEKHERDGMTIYPLLIRACSWENVAWLARMQLRPKDAKPISLSRRAKIDQILAEVASEIAELARNTSNGATADHSGPLVAAQRQFVVGQALPAVAPVTVATSATPKVPGRVGIVYCGRCGMVPGRSTACANAGSHSFLKPSPDRFVYCGSCGVKPGDAPTRCLRGYGHSFLQKEAGGVIHCGACGVVPGDAPTNCLRGRSHSFLHKEAGGVIHCGACGVVPGDAPTNCLRGHSHSFLQKEAGGVIHCGACGVVPGDAPTNCLRGHSHSFLQKKMGGLIHCGACGAAPGNVPTECLHRRSHSFVNA